MRKVNAPTSQTYCFKCFTIPVYNFTGVSEKHFQMFQIEGVDKVNKTLYYKCKLCTLLLVNAPRI